MGRRCLGSGVTYHRIQRSAARGEDVCVFRFVDVTYVCRDMLVCAVLGARLSFHIRDSSLSNICATVEVTYVQLSIVTKGHWISG